MHIDPELIVLVHMVKGGKSCNGYDCNHHGLIMLVHVLSSDNLMKPEENTQNMGLHQEQDHGILKSVLFY